MYGIWKFSISLNKTGFCSKFYNIIKSMYKNTELCVKIDSYRTECFKSNIGVDKDIARVRTYLIYTLLIYQIILILHETQSPYKLKFY